MRSRTARERSLWRVVGLSAVLFTAELVWAL